MNIKDYIGKRGEVIFPMLITKWCNGRPWFDSTFLGEKAEAKGHFSLIATSKVWPLQRKLLRA